jgi:hypothetical protein
MMIGLYLLPDAVAVDGDDAIEADAREGVAARVVLFVVRDNAIAARSSCASIISCPAK